MYSRGFLPMNASHEPRTEPLRRAFARIGEWSYDHRWVVLLFAGAVWGAGGYLASKAGVDNSLAAFFDSEDPTYSAYQQYRLDFGSDENAYIVYRAADGPWDLDVMRKIEGLTRALEDEVPFVRKVTSLSNAEFMEGAPPDDILVYDLLADFPRDQEELFATRDKVMKKPLYVGGLVDADNTLGAITIDMSRSTTDPVETIQADPNAGFGMDNLYPRASFDAIETILSRPEYAGIEFFHTGDVAINAEYNRILVERDLPIITLAILVMIAFTLGTTFRNAFAVVGPFLVIAFSVAISVAVIGAFGWSIDFIFGLMPTLMITVGIADSVHILSEFQVCQRECDSRRAAISKTLYLVGPPCLLTTLTTAVGFLSLSFSPVKSIAHLALFSAAGVVAAFFASCTLLIAFLSFGGPTANSTRDGFERTTAKGSERFVAGLRRLTEFVIRARNPILVSFAALFIVGGWGLTKLRVDSDFIGGFPESTPIRRVTQFADDHMAGTMSIVYLFDSEAPDGIKDPRVLREIERVQEHAAGLSLVTKTYSIVDLIKDINQSFHNGDPAYYKIPDSRELIAQYLLVYEFSGGDEVKDYVSNDYQRSALEIRVPQVATSRLAAVVDELDEYLAEAPLEASRLDKTGAGMLWLKFVEHLSWSQINGALIALTVICLMMIVLFRSVKLGLLSMIPNITPVVLVLGMMGWIGSPLDYYRLLIAPVAIGLAVDDTIHFVSRYRHEFLNCGNYEKALHDAMGDVGRALWITSVVLTAGFLMNCFGAMDSTKGFGVALASVITIALAGDFLLMPALILWLKPFGPEGPRKHAESEAPHAAFNNPTHVGVRHRGGEHPPGSLAAKH